MTINQAQKAAREIEELYKCSVVWAGENRFIIVKNGHTEWITYKFAIGNCKGYPEI